MKKTAEGTEWLIEQFAKQVPLLGFTTDPNKMEWQSEGTLGPKPAVRSWVKGGSHLTYTRSIETEVQMTLFGFALFRPSGDGGYIMMAHDEMNAIVVQPGQPIAVSVTIIP